MSPNSPNNQQPPAGPPSQFSYSQSQGTAPTGQVPANYPQYPAPPQGNYPAVQAPAQPPAVQSSTNDQPTQDTKKKAPPKPATTQNSLLLSELRDDMIIMGDGSFRAVIACESINFDLMSAREREGVEYSYQNFLNALYFPVQICIRSQRVDIGPYLDKLVAIQRTQDNMLLSVLMEDYINFIDDLSQNANIMDKSFYVVIPYYPAGEGTILDQSKGFFTKLFAPKNTNTVTKISKETYERAREEIRNRADTILNGLMQIGVRAVQLKTKELGTLYYNMYNPDTAVREPLGDFNNVTSTFVRKGEGAVPTSTAYHKGDF